MHRTHRPLPDLPVLAVTLQLGDRVDEQRVFPRLAVALRMLRGDHVSGGFFHHRISQALQGAQNRGLTGARGTGHDETPHRELILI